MLAGAICVVLCLTGCAERRARAKVFPWDIVANLHPLIPEAPDAPEATEAAFDDVGSPLLTEIAPPPSPLIAARSAPARPRLPPGPAASTEAASRPDVPQIAPQLTAAETAAAQQQTNQSLTVAGRNLEAIQGRSLNGTQTDLASKIRSFIAEAREAAQIGDWTRARNAAKKAEVLSQELASSL
jgi:hypothetical protein